MTIKLFDLPAENAAIKDAFFEKLGHLYDEANFAAGYGKGPVEELEERFAALCDRRFAIGTGSGTLALEMASVALGLGPGDEVIVPANTFIATASAPARTGATIVAADVDERTWNVSAQTVEKVFTPRTKAVFAVNIYGNPFPFEALQSFGVPIVEDAAHSHGAVYRSSSGKRCNSGSLGELSAFSFFPSKVMGGIGDSGMLLLDGEDRYRELLAYRNCGQTKKHYASSLGTVARMDVIQALFLLEKLRILTDLLTHRRKLAAVYNARFAGSGIQTQGILPGCEHGYFVYVVRVPDRRKVCAALDAAGIPWSIQYPYLLNQQEFWGKINSRKAEVPVAEKLVSQIISLPMNHGLSEAQAGFVAETILRCL